MIEGEKVRISYYPGCSLHGTALEYDQSLKAVVECLGIELVELPDWNCCGASSAHALDFTLAKNLAVLIGHCRKTRDESGSALCRLL